MRYGKLIYRLSFLLCIISLISTAYLGYAYHEQHDSDRIERRAKKEALEKARNAISEIKIEFEYVKDVVDTISNTLNDSDLSDKQLKDLLKQHIDKKGLQLKQVGVAYSEYAYDARKRLYSPGYTRDKEGQLSFDNAIYDYTLSDSPELRTSWYHIPMNKGATWLEPYWGTGAQVYLAEYVAPFNGIHAKTRKRERIGIIYANYSLESLRNKVDKLDLGSTGYGFIVTKGNNIVSHPIKHYMGKPIKAIDDNVLQKVFSSANETGINYTSAKTGQSYWLFYLPVESTDWNLGLVLNAKDFLPSAKEKRQDIFLIVIGCLFFLFFLSFIIFRADLGESRNLIKFAAFTSLLCFLGLITVWNISINAGEDEQSFKKIASKEEAFNDGIPNIKVFESAGTHVVLANCTGSNPDIKTIPTGVFVQSVNFTSANNVVMTGYIWQNRPTGPVTGSEPIIILPEAEDISIEHTYEAQEDGKYLAGWYFKATLRQQFDDSKYPFDREDVWLRLWNSDLNRDAILIPDFDSYDIIAPATKPGLEKQFVLEGWDIENSYFSYRNIPYNTKFGYKDHGAKNNCPELYFNIGVKRKFIHPFISDMLPLFVISILLFGVLLISSKNEQKISLFGFNTSQVLTYCAALFFVLIVSHVHLRQSIASQSIIYLEYFYFVMYVVILFVSANSILFVSSENLRLIHYKDNFLVKTFYWPALMLSLLIISLFIFF